MELTIRLSEEAVRRMEAIADGDQTSVEVVASALLEEALDRMERKALASALVAQARQRAATEEISNEEWGRRFVQVREAILQEAIEKGTAIDGDFLAEDN